MSNSAFDPSIRRRAFVARQDCPLALAADILGDRWTLLILREAFYGVQRYDDMREDLGAPRSMLTDRLARLVERGLMERRTYQEPGSRKRQAYVLTQAGRELALTLIALMQWGEAHVTGKPAPIEIVDKTTGRRLRAALVDDEGDSVDPGAARMARRAEG